jgi:hypothetical protein
MTRELSGETRPDDVQCCAAVESFGSAKGAYLTIRNAHGPGGHDVSPCSRDDYLSIVGRDEFAERTQSYGKNLEAKASLPLL